MMVMVMEYILLMDSILQYSIIAIGSSIVSHSSSLQNLQDIYMIYLKSSPNHRVFSSSKNHAPFKSGALENLHPVFYAEPPNVVVSTPPKVDPASTKSAAIVGKWPSACRSGGRLTSLWETMRKTTWF